MLDLVGSNADGAVFDVGMALLPSRYGDAPSLALVALGHGDDGFRQGGREQQGPPFLWRRFKNEFQILAEAKVEHLIGLVEDHGFQLGDAQTTAFQMIAQAARGSDDDMRATGQHPLLGARVHAADARHHPSTGMLVEPSQFAMHLQSQFAGRCDDQGERFIRRSQRHGVAKQGAGDRQAIGDRLA